MKSRVWHSFRVEIILYTFLSMIYSVLTVAAICGVFYFFTSTSRKAVNEAAEEKNFYVKEEPKTASEHSTIKNNNKKELGRVYYERPRHLFEVWGIAIAIFVLLFFILYFLLLTRKITLYLDEITEGIQELSAGNFDVQISVRNEDELATIAQGLNKMAGDLKLMMENEHNAENAKRELITNVAHDLRTPLTSIIGYLGLVYSNDKLDIDTKMHYIKIAYDKSKRLESLIEDLFSFTKVDFGQITLHKSTVDMVKFIEQLIDEFYPSITDANLEIQFDCKENFVPFELDGELMARALANLMSNAIKYGRDGKILRMELKKSEKWIKILVINYGKIIPKEDLEHIFDKFYRVESSRSSETGGTGLGLAIARNIVRLHDGIIRVKSDPDGTVFTITLYYHSEDNPEGREEEI